MSENGKGDSPRPFSVDQETYKSNYDRIFGMKDDRCEYSGLPSASSYVAPLPDDIQKKIDDIITRMDAYEQSLQHEVDGEDEDE